MVFLKLSIFLLSVVFFVAARIQKLTGPLEMGQTPPSDPSDLSSAPGFFLRWTPPPARLVTWELRRYQLVLGYTTVPRFLELYGAGLPEKLRVDQTGASTLATLLYSDCGPLNVVVEVWRHESLQRALDSRQASRQATKWKEAIGEIAKLGQSFSTLYMRPLDSSPWQ